VGLLDPRITGTNDALISAADRLDWTAHDGSPVPPPPQLVRTRGGAYCFVPSLPALQWIASEGP
jgi:hypothetical protein